MTEPFVPERKRIDFPQMLPLAWSDCIFLFYSLSIFKRTSTCVMCSSRGLTSLPCSPGQACLPWDWVPCSGKWGGLISQVHGSPLLQLPSCVQIRPSHFCWKTLQCQKFLMLTPSNVRNLLGKSVSPEEKNVHSVSGEPEERRGSRQGSASLKC